VLTHPLVLRLQPDEHPVGSRDLLLFAPAAAAGVDYASAAGCGNRPLALTPASAEQTRRYRRNGSLPYAAVNRTPPLEVRRELRREVGFGCPVDGCGSPYLTWHHFDPPWNEHQHHDVAGMVALCREHHDKADAGAFTREQLRQLKTKRADRVAGRFDWMRQDLLLVVGGNFYYRTPVPVQFRGDPVVSTTRDEEGQLLVSLGMLTTSSESRLRMTENFWISEGRPSDLECPPSGRRIAVTYGNGDLLSIEFSGVSEPAELGTRYPDASPERWQLTYPVMTVEVRMRVGGTPLEFGPTQTTLPGNNMMRGCFAADCAVGLAFG